MDNKQITDLFEVLKTEFSMSQRDVAARLGLTESYLSKILNSKKDLTSSFFKKLLRFLRKLSAETPAKADALLSFISGLSIYDLPEGELLRQQKAFGSGRSKGTIAVPIKVQANYSRNISNPLFYKELERFYFPNNPYDGDNFRFFQMEGDSMEYIDENGRVSGLPDGSWIIAERVPMEDWRQNLRQYYVHVVVTETMLTIKRILQDNDTEIVLHADNDLYGQLRVSLGDVKEIWLFKRRLDWNAPPPRRIEIVV